MSPPRLDRRTSFALGLVLVLSFALRLAGIDRLLPHRPEPDPFVVLQLQELEGDPTKSWQTHYYERYPLLIARALSLLPAPPMPARPSASESADGESFRRVHLAAASAPFVRVRLAAALCSGLLAALTFFVARRFVRDRAALLAALLVATSLLSLLYAQQGRPHAVAATLALGTVLLSLRASERPSPARIVLAALSAAASVATLQPGVFALPPLAVAVFLIVGAARPEDGRRARVVAAGAIALGVTLGAALLGGLFYSERPYVDATGLHLAPATKGGHTISPSDWNGLGFPRGAALLWEHDPALAAATAIGLVFALATLVQRRNALLGEGGRALAIVLAYALPYAAIVGANGEVYERFLIPLLPYFALVAAAAVDAAAGAIAVRLRSAAARSATLGVSYALVLAFPLVASACYARAAVLPDTQEQAARWIADNVPVEARILASSGLFLPLVNDPVSLALNLADPSGRSSPWFLYEGLLAREDLVRHGRPIVQFPAQLGFQKPVVDPQAAERRIEELGAGYVVIEDSPRRLEWPMQDLLRQAAEARGELVFRSRWRAPEILELRLIDYQAVRDLARRILSTRAFGPGVDVYRIRR